VGEKTSKVPIKRVIAMAKQQLNFRRQAEPSGTLIVWRKLHRRHLQWALLAVVFSLLLHVLLILVFPGLTIYGFSREMLAEKVRVAVQLRDVRLQPAPGEEDRRPARFRPDSAGGTVAGDSAAESMAFRKPIDQADVEPRRVGAGSLAGEKQGLVEPVAVDRPVWEPRQEVFSINRKLVDDEKAALPRRYVSAIPRQANAGDIAGPADREDIGKGVGVGVSYDYIDDPSRFGWGRASAGGGGDGGRRPEKIIVEEPKRFDERQRASVLKALEKYLKADVYVYRPALDSRYGYCRIEIKRRTDELLPVLNKDLLLVQDASASITEQKLYFCREGMLKALELLGPDDRFNVVEFRDVAKRCFPEWSAVNPDTLQKAREFIGDMRSIGDTDIFGSLKELLELPRKSGRPVVTMVVSDGVATVGLTDRAQIIETFSQENQGSVSVFTMGTYAGANAYLLDLLSYRNRGDTFIVKTGRWDIPAVLEAQVREVSRPVLSDVRFRFAGQVWCEAYPALTSNLYLDRPLVLFGRFPKAARQLIFQATGRADDIQCDMVFDIDLSKAMEGDKGIQTDWAWQKVYALIGEHTKTRNDGLMVELKQLRKDYGIKIPYRNELTR
jgi:hypothetical protein